MKLPGKHIEIVSATAQQKAKIKPKKTKVSKKDYVDADYILEHPQDFDGVTIKLRKYENTEV